VAVHPLRPRLSFAIQAHPARHELAGWLAQQITGDVEIVYDPDPDSPVRSPWRTMRELLTRTPDTATHRVQIQDDTIVCQGFRGAVTAATTARPDSLFCLFVSQQHTSATEQILNACRNDRAWASVSPVPWVPAVATVWPVELIGRCLDWMSRQPWPDDYSADDERIGRFCQYEGVQVWATVPCLVEHPDVVPSLLGQYKTGYGGNPERLAACFIGDGDPAEIPW
jgi:hypothetical protein